MRTPALIALLLSLCVSALCAPLPDVALPARNFVNNGGFERGTEGWKYFSQPYGAVVTDEHHTGSSCFKATGLKDNYCYFQQDGVPLVPGKTYTLSAWLKSSGFKRAGDNTTFLNLVNWGWTKSGMTGPAKADEDWTRYSVTFAAPETKLIGDRPFYNLVIFWPIKSEGTVWVDDLQIEEGDKPTGFTDQYLGWAFETQQKLRAAYALAQGSRAALAANLSALALAKTLDAQAADLMTQAEAITKQLGSYATLSIATARDLPTRAEQLRQQAEALKYVYYLGNPYVPLPEQPPPAMPPATMEVNWTCLSGEQRAVAVNVVNLTGHATTGRLEPGELYDLSRQLRCPGVPWLTAYSAPVIRGFLSPEKLFTDPLPKVDEAGCFAIGDGQVSQAVLLVDTASLLPGEYQGEVTLAALTEATGKRVVKFHLTVLPVRLPPLSGVDICDIGNTEDWAKASVGPMGLNTFFVQAQWLLPEYDPSGKLAMKVDFSRAAAAVQDKLAICPNARFVLGFGIGAIVTGYLERTYSLQPFDPKFSDCVTRWVREVVQGFGELGVGPERIIFETIDEPGPGQLALAAQWSTLIRAAEPKARSMSYLTSLDPTDPALLRVYEALDIIAPAVSCLTAEKVAKLKQMGKTVWTYDCQNSGETFHPIAYYRLLPWLAWRHQLGGWGHFEWLAADRGRSYRVWEGVSEEAVVYPASDGGQVISRRWLALVAGVQDYRTLQLLTALTAAVRQSNPQAPAVTAADKLLREAPTKALALLKPEGDYFTGLAPNADPALLDRFREEAASVARDLGAAMGGATPLRATLDSSDAKSQVRLSLPRRGRLTLQYLCNRKLPWRTVSADVPAGAQIMPIPSEPNTAVTRCFVSLTDDNGLLKVISATPLVKVTVDSSAEGYSPTLLNDGLATPGMKFEPDRGWISSGAGTEHWVEAALDSPRPLTQARVWWMTFGGLPQAYKLQLWAQGQWRDAPGFGEWRAARSTVETLRFPPTDTEKIRVLQKAGGGGHGVPSMMGLSEIEVE